MVEHSCRQCTQKRKPSAKAPRITICTSLGFYSPFDQAIKRYAKKGKEQDQSDESKLAKNLQKDLMGMDHRFGSLDGIRKVMCCEILISQSDAKGMIADHFPRASPYKYSISGGRLVQISNALKTIDDISRQKEGRRNRRYNSDHQAFSRMTAEQKKKQKDHQHCPQPSAARPGKNQA